MGRFKSGQNVHGNQIRFYEAKSDFRKQTAIDVSGNLNSEYGRFSEIGFCEVHPWPNTKPNKN